MNPALENKLQELKNAKNYECWYLVKQQIDFAGVCYLVSFLADFKAETPSTNLEEYIKNKSTILNSQEPQAQIPNTYRALRVAAFFGLIEMHTLKYAEASITKVFYEINNRCGGHFENTASYNDILQRQIEKIFVSSEIDEEYNGVRQGFRLYPVMLLYKILLEIGLSCGDHSISMTEYRYFAATTKKFTDFLDTLLLIKLLREDETAVPHFEQYRGKFDNRFIKALEQLNTLCIDGERISLKSDAIQDVSQKVFTFENKIVGNIDEAQYTAFLCSTKSLYDLGSIKYCAKNMQYTHNYAQTIYYGVPGSGKSHKVDEYIKGEKDVDEEQVIRVVFHPDYTNADFVGQIMPTMTGENKDKIEYLSKPGPFTQILRRAYQNPARKYFLVIEEINRGNAAAIFGDIFQLLDRFRAGENDDPYGEGWSRYCVTNDVVADCIRKVSKADAIDVASLLDRDNIRLPPNLSLLATMNTSDQNVFVLDNAFQRRWNMQLVKNEFAADDISQKQHNAMILGADNMEIITWGDFQRQINAFIGKMQSDMGMGSMEDKRLGCWFVVAENQGGRYVIPCDTFKNKVLKYLWDDAFKLGRESAFADDVSSLEELQAKFDKTGLDIFSNECRLNEFIKTNGSTLSANHEDGTQSDGLQNG